MQFEELKKSAVDVVRTYLPNHDWNDRQLVLAVVITLVLVLIWAVTIAFLMLAAVMALVTHASVGGLVLVVMAVFAAALHLTPNAIAIVRNHPQAPAISALNLLLGWICVGWVISLVWALTTTRN